MKKLPIATAVAMALLYQPVSAQQEASESARVPLDSTGIDRARVTSGTQFNPSISVILDAVYFNEFSGEIEGPAGFDDGHDHGHGDDHGHGEVENGFNLRETEVTLTASIDNYLDGVAVLAIDGESGIEVEEAYILTRSLPAGLQLKAGRFLSDIGYINRQHPHDWDFVDRPLVSEHLFGNHGLQENGLQLSWLAPTAFYSRFGVEVLQGENSGVANHVGSGSHTVTGYDTDTDGPNDGSRARSQVDYGLRDESGPRLVTAFAKFSPDLGFNHAAQFGLSGGSASAWQNVETHGSGRVDVWDGDAWFAGVDAVYKYDAGRSFGQGNWTVQAEYFYREIDATYQNRNPDAWDNDPDAGWNIDNEWSGKAKQDGVYLQTLYGFAPRWNIGLRAEALGLTNDSLEANRSENEFESFDTSWRYSAQVSFMPTEFSRLRLQVNHYDYAHDDDDDHHNDGAWAVMLQYNMSLGAHGAHQF